MYQESESEEEGVDDVDDDNEEEPEHEPDVLLQEKDPVIEKAAEVVAPKDSERQLSKKELKKKELAELEEMLAQFGYNKPEDQDATHGNFCISVLLILLKLLCLTLYVLTNA